MGIDLFGSTYSVLGKALDLRSQRHSLIAANIANADTPGYKSRSLKFEDELKKIVPSTDKMSLKRTNRNHFPISNNNNDVTPAVIQDDTQIIRPDGNTVDLDKEFVKMSENHIMYDSIAQILGRKYKGLLAAIKEVR
jgi:flagellar basal-body rod protein FlgB